MYERITGDNIAEVKKFIKKNEIEFVDFKLVDFRGRFRHLTIPASNLDETTMNNWDYEFRGYNLGRYVMPLYTFAMIDAKTGCLKFSYLHRTNMISVKHIKDLQEGTIRAIMSGIDNPDITIGEILDKI